MTRPRKKKASKAKRMIRKFNVNYDEFYCSRSSAITRKRSIFPMWSQALVTAEENQIQDS